MSYLGNTPTQQAFAPAIDYFSGDGSTVAFTLSRPVASVAQAQAVIENVAQNPTSAFTVSGNTITFTSAPPSGTNNIYVYYTSPITQVAALPQNPQVFGNLQFSSAGSRITGDFSNATIANRVMFQTSTANSATSVSTVPSGTNTQSDFFAFNAADPNNASLLLMRAGAAETTLRSAITGTGSYLPMTFYTGGSERMRIDTSGNVGIGTSSPTAQLQQYLSSGTTYRQITNGSVNITEYASTAVATCVYGTTSNHPLAFTTNNTERMRIDTSGNLLVGTTVADLITGTGLILQPGGYVISKFNITTTNNVWTLNNNNATGTTYTVEFRQNNVYKGAISVSSTATAYNSASDYRMKENVQPMIGALEKVAQLKPCTYTWKENGIAGQGFIAHELQEVCPDAVHGEKDAVDADGNPVYQGIDTSFLVATLTAAIQELNAKFEEYKATHP